MNTYKRDLAMIDERDSFQRGRTDRIRGLPCRESNGFYLDGWYSVAEGNLRVLALYDAMFPGRAYPGDHGAHQQAAELRGAAQTMLGLAKLKAVFEPIFNSAIRSSLDAAKAEGAATRKRRRVRRAGVVARAAGFERATGRDL